MSNVDLQQFCGDETGISYLMRPWSFNDWSYATDSHIVVRIPRRADDAAAGPDHPAALKAEKYFADLPGGDFVPLPAVTIPTDKTFDCDECGGTGRDHLCPSCKCVCEECGGTGTDKSPLGSISVGIGDFVIAAKYFLLLHQLPGCLISTRAIDDGPISFKFDGGEGLLMPLRYEDRFHIRAEMASAA
jgi:hypothetical protein